MAPVLAYWNIRGLAQPIRLLLAYTSMEYEEKLYECGPSPSYDKSCWFDVKFKLELDFPNLPYYIDGDVKVTQSNAIMRHIARKHDLCGTTEQEKIRIDMMENQSMDFRNGLVRLCYHPNFDALKDEYLKTLPSSLKEFSDFLGNYSWFAGQKITFVDFIIYELLDQHRILSPGCLKEFTNLVEFMDRFEALDKISEYMKSGRFMKAPLNNKMAKFGNA